MSLVWSCNEWDPLEEVIVGNPLYARFPYPDLSTQVTEYPDRPLSEIPRGPFERVLPLPCPVESARFEVEHGVVLVHLRKASPKSGHSEPPTRQKKSS